MLTELSFCLVKFSRDGFGFKLEFDLDINFLTYSKSVLFLALGVERLSI